MHKTTQINENNFVCERLSWNKNNRHKIKEFVSRENSGMTTYLQRCAWFEDSKNIRAVYLIKDGEKIVAYFSLQYGLMIKCHNKVLHGISHRFANEKCEYFIDDDIVDVTTILPSIEIAHFCTNDVYRKKKSPWVIKNIISEYTVGQYIYHKYVLPLILEAANIAGLQMAYLFCADNGSEKLIEYYKDLGFKIMDDMACIRSEYDATLQCMTCKLQTISEKITDFNDEWIATDIVTHMKKTGRTVTYAEAKNTFGVKNPEHIFSIMVDKGLVKWSTASRQQIKIKK